MVFSKQSNALRQSQCNKSMRGKGNGLLVSFSGRVCKWTQFVIQAVYT